MDIYNFDIKTMKVKIKKLSKEAVIPIYSKDGDAGLDLTATSKTEDSDGNIVYGTGLSIEIPKGYVGLLLPRSSISKKQMFLTNSVGVIDSGYRGEVMVKFKPTVLSKRILVKLSVLLNFIYRIYKEENEYQVGDRVAQMIIIPYPQIEFEEVEELSQTDRGNGGFGSTGS